MESRPPELRPSVSPFTSEKTGFFEDGRGNQGLQTGRLCFNHLLFPPHFLAPRCTVTWCQLSKTRHLREPSRGVSVTRHWKPYKQAVRTPACGEAVADMKGRHDGSCVGPPHRGWAFWEGGPPPPFLAACVYVSVLAAIIVWPLYLLIFASLAILPRSHPSNPWAGSSHPHQGSPPRLINSEHTASECTVLSYA